MKLRNLNGAIRKQEGPVKVHFRLSDQIGPMDLFLVKAPLLEALKKAVGDDSTAETGLWINDQGYLMREGEGVAPQLSDKAEDESETPASVLNLLG